MRWSAWLRPSALVLVTALSWGGDQLRFLPLRIAEPPSAQLSLSDLSCGEVFLSPYIPTGQRTTSMPMTFRRDGGRRQFFVYGGDGHFRSFKQPLVTSACNTPLNSIVQATYDTHATRGDWGFVHMAAAGDFVPGINATFAQRAFYDAPTSTFALTWVGTYSTVPPSNTFNRMQLDEVNHVVQTVGCYGLLDFTMARTGMGIVALPDAFVSTYLPAGRRWGVLGGAFAYATQNSYGPQVVAIAPPADNTCDVGVNHNIADYSVLEAHGNNAIGPNCAVDGLGCTPPVAPTTPYPAKLTFPYYSDWMYAETWDPWYISGLSGPKHGWYSWETFFDVGVYDDGVKKGILVPIVTPSGWATETVLASPTPTYSGGIGTFSVASTDTHDGYHMNLGDTIWVQTCDIVVEPVCGGGNGRQLAIGVITAVNTGTGAITYSVISNDFGTTHIPVPGKPVFFGGVYAHGGPTSSRSTPLWQMYSFAQWAEVLAGTREAYAVEAIEEDTMAMVIPHVGAPSSGAGIVGSAANAGYVVGPAIIPEPSAQEIVVIMNAVKFFGGEPASLIYVVDVSHASARPTPTPASSWPLIPAPLLAAVWYERRRLREVA